MASIYAGAHITIAATGAENNRAGLFVDGNQTATWVPCPYGEGKSLDLYLRKAIPHALFWEEDVVPDQDPKDDPRLPLLARGWVYQERILSPRVLHLTRDELVWECMQNSDCDAWHDIVTGYTSKHLTYEKDRLPALSGLARRFGQMKPGVAYLGGLWRDSLGLDLLWFIAGRVKSEVIDIRLPSWSWASVTGKVCYNYDEKIDKIAMEILQAECDVLGSDPTGEIRSGKIVLKGMMEPLKGLLPRDSSWLKMVTTPFEEVQIYGSYYTIALDEKCLDVTIYWDAGEYTCESLYLLKGSETKYHVRFLVLINVDNPPTDRFWRIGIGNWEDSSHEKSKRPFARSIPQTITLV